MRYARPFVDASVLGWERILLQLRAWGGRPLDPRGDPASGAAYVFSAGARLGLFAAFTMLVVLRLWQAVWHGRFLAEDGTIFFAYGWHSPAWDALWRSFGGYLNLGANATTLLAARLVRDGTLSLENAPHLTMAVALLFQVLPALFLLAGRGRWLANRWAVVASLLVVALCPTGEEVWLNSMHIQFHLILCCGLMLAMAVPASFAGRIGCWLVLVLATLCGPGAIVLMPLFALRSLMERDLHRMAQTVALTAGSLVQLLVFFTPSPLRGDFLDPATLATVLLVRLGALPFGGIIISDRVGQIVDNAYVAGGIGWWVIVAISLVYCGFLGFLALRHRREESGWLIAAGLSVAVASFGGGMLVTPHSAWFGAVVGARYNFVPLVLPGLALVGLASRSSERYRQVPLKLCVFVVLLISAIRYPYPLLHLAEGPRWRDEVAIWRQNHDYRLQVWPAGWTVDLSDKDRPCPKSTLARKSEADPQYCESAWADFMKSYLSRPYKFIDQ
jgi:hypothetical protein